MVAMVGRNCMFITRGLDKFGMRDCDTPGSIQEYDVGLHMVTRTDSKLQHRANQKTRTKTQHHLCKISNTVAQSQTRMMPTYLNNIGTVEWEVIQLVHKVPMNQGKERRVEMIHKGKNNKIIMSDSF